MNKIYLDENLKNYYTNCLLEEIKLENIDKGIEDYLLLICKNNSIRPIFSKKGIDFGKHYSYLKISYSKHSEDTILKKVIPYFETEYSDNRYKCVCCEIKPYIQTKRKVTIENEGSKWLVDSNYFNISQIRFELKGGSEDLHEKFWSELSLQLSELD
ncbi:hypothetical protein RBH94_06595 [Aestuariibaculum sp. YM273]|uniref:hypothetical protein n=1 Tax=Aestuariibaculum sp. YM273 TaxID=3070659 RepID=UPI0027DEA3DC|nr:hypothetical protein [Aestuariibaculum sp. YM273]WMI66827.1 hypothetical protein RBH94_06595 [Aestuariibaculum sp. YM273]